MPVKILYVEDETSLGQIVKESLESRGYEVHMVSHGAEAVPLFCEIAPDICVLDVMLPGKNGFEIGEEVRAGDPEVPIIYLTAKDQTKDILKGFGSGGNDYIKKPFSLEELIVRINNLLALTNGKPTPAANGDEIGLGEYIYRPNILELEYKSQIRKLSHRENELFKIFVDSNGKAIERKDILMKVWGDDSFFNSRNLDVYIKKIRNYLQEDPNVKLITLKGVGYHFVSP